MVAGRYDPQIAEAVGYDHGDPLEGVDGGTDGAAALARFVNTAMADYEEPLRTALLNDVVDDGMRRLRNLRDVTQEDLVGLPNWTKHLARDFLREADLMVRVMGWREPEVVAASVQPEVVVHHGVRHRDRAFPKPPTAVDAAHAGWGPWGVGRAPVDWGYTTPGWAGEFCKNGDTARRCLTELLTNPISGVLGIQVTLMGEDDDAFLHQRFMEVLEPEQLEWLGPAIVRGSSFLEALYKIVGKRHGKEKERKKEEKKRKNRDNADILILKIHSFFGCNDWTSHQRPHLPWYSAQPARKAGANPLVSAIGSPPARGSSEA